jgi:hypothetical protein
MSVHRFIKCSDSTMKKTFEVSHDTTYIYRISVSQDIWSPSIRVMCHTWVQECKKGIIKPFKCIGCKKSFKTRRGLTNHVRKCKMNSTQLITKSDTSLEEPQNEIMKQIRSFGKENPKWLTSDLLYGVLSNIKDAIPVMMRKKHFNDNFPENKNLQIDAKRNIDERMQVFEEGRWTIKGSKQTFYKVLVSVCDILSEALEEDDNVGESTPEEYESDSDNEDTHIGKQIRRLRNSDKFIRKINKIRPLWHKFREKISNPEQRTDLWEDLKTLLLDRQLAIEQGFI